MPIRNRFEVSPTAIYRDLCNQCTICHAISLQATNDNKKQQKEELPKHAGYNDPFKRKKEEPTYLLWYIHRQGNLAIVSPERKEKTNVIN